MWWWWGEGGKGGEGEGRGGGTPSPHPVCVCSGGGGGRGCGRTNPINIHKVVGNAAGRVAVLGPRPVDCETAAGLVGHISSSRHLDADCTDHPGLHTDTVAQCFQ